MVGSLQLTRYYYTSIIVHMKHREHLSKLIDVFLSLRTKEDMRKFLEGILTPSELEEIPVRLEIVEMLKKGIPQHEISQKLGVGIATVTRGSKEIQKGMFENIGI